MIGPRASSSRLLRLVPQHRAPGLFYFAKRNETKRMIFTNAKALKNTVVRAVRRGSPPERDAFLRLAEYERLGKIVHC